MKRIRWFFATFWSSIAAACMALAVGAAGRMYGLLAGLWVILGGVAAVMVFAFAYGFITGVVRDWPDVKRMLKVIICGPGEAR